MTVPTAGGMGSRREHTMTAPTVVEERLYSTKEISTRLGIPMKPLDHWIREGVTEVARPATGTGSRIGWSVEDAYFAWLMKHCPLAHLEDRAACIATWLEVGDEYLISETVSVTLDSAAVKREFTERMTAELEPWASASLPLHERPVLISKEAAEYAGVSAITISRWTAGGGLPSHKVGSARKIRRADLDDFLSKRQQENDQ